MKLGLVAHVALSGSASKATIGSTVTAQLMDFKITDYALRLVIVGFGLIFLFNMFAAHADGEPGIERSQEISEDR